MRHTLWTRPRGDLWLPLASHAFLILHSARLTIGLPLYGAKTSLNVAVAFGVAAYGLVARYRSLGAP